MNLTILMTRLPYAVFLSVLLFASNAKKPDNKSDPASNENEEKAICGILLTHDVFDKWYHKMWIYPFTWILGLINGNLEQAPYTTIKKFDVSLDDPGSGAHTEEFLTPLFNSPGNLP